MKSPSLRITGAACVLTALLLAAGCRGRDNKISILGPSTPDYSTDVQQLVSSKTLPTLRWPNYGDYQPLVQSFYSSRQNDIVWSHEGKPTAQATAFIDAFEHADTKGLKPEDYDATKWAARVQQLLGKSPEAIAQFDVAMTITTMRFLSDLHMGRIAPQHFGFEIDAQSKRLDLPKFLTEQAISSTDVSQLISSVEPDSELYRQTEQALVRYQGLAKQQEQTPADPLPTVDKALTVGMTYHAVPALWQRLQLEGDAPADQEAPTTYNKEVAAAVKHYQHRHGLTDDGHLTAATIKNLNVPLSDRVTQLENALERWRWLPEPYLNPRLMVNLPEFLLRGFTPEHELAFSMKVVDGKVQGEHFTPVFAHMMRYLIFRPYWNVPVDIAKKELVPHMVAKPGYLESRNYEVITSKGKVLTEYTTNMVAHGMVMVREKPGPGNSLGLVKFMFPNQYDIYLHSTPETYLFARTRRDYSHGCIRVQKPDELAVWVLDGQKDHGEEWDLDKVNDAMKTGPDNRQISLKTPLPIVIFYLTAIPTDDEVHFFDDIYHYDQQLDEALAKGMPYPKAPEPVKVKTKPGDTV